MLPGPHVATGFLRLLERQEARRRPALAVRDPEQDHVRAAVRPVGHCVAGDVRACSRAPGFYPRQRTLFEFSKDARRHLSVKIVSHLNYSTVKPSAIIASAIACA